MAESSRIHAAGVGDGMGIECIPGASDDKESACNARVAGSDPWVRKIPGEGNGRLSIPDNLVASFFSLAGLT